MDTVSPCTIRRMNPDDAHAWAQLRQEALESHPLAFGASLPDKFSALVETAIDRLKTSEDSAVFGAFIGNALVGTVGIRRDDGAKERHKSLLVAMYVRSGNRRTGVGELLARSAIRHARSWEGVEQIQLVVNDVAPEAKRLYERLGFRIWGIEPRSLRHNGVYTEATHMILDLRERENS
jgi:RimJ/RimL family protein N-acetyltransferase